jgi:hypothetical protein
MAYMIGTFALGLALTLVLAAFLTPRRWWRRPNLRALAILAAGTWGLGSLMLSLLPLLPLLSMLPPAPAMASMKTSEPAPVAVLVAIRPGAAAAGRTYRVFEHLNLRAAGGTGTRRLVVVPPKTLVTTTGAREGDWWEVSARIEGRQITGWVSSKNRRVRLPRKRISTLPDCQRFIGASRP